MCRRVINKLSSSAKHRNRDPKLRNEPKLVDVNKEQREPTNIQGREKTITALVTELKQCTKVRDLERGKALHLNAVETGCANDKYVASTLIRMYSKCRSMPDARAVFNNLNRRTAVSWTSLILGYVENGESLVALESFSNMDCEPDSVTFVAALKACTELLSLQKGMVIHKLAQERGFDTDVYVASTLVDMYSKCGSMSGARDVFNKTKHRNVVLWTSLILGYVDNGESLVALELYKEMDCEPNAVTFVAAFKACASLACVEEGKAIHRQAKDRGFDKHLSVANTLVDMYSKCGNMTLAWSTFIHITHRDVVSWNTLIHGYVENGERLLSLDLFSRMDCEPNSVTFVAALKACAGLAREDRKLYLERGMMIHQQVKERGFDADIFVASTLVDMYSKCGSMKKAREVFDNMASRNTVSWDSLILGYVENEESAEALQLFGSMDCEPDCVTFLAAVRACAALAVENKQVYLEKGMDIHRQAKECGFDLNMLVANSLVDMYCKCKSMVDARDVFESMTHRDAASWTSLILGYVENEEGLVAIDLFTRIDCEPDFVTFVAVLKACASIAAVGTGQGVHAHICKLGLEQKQAVANGLVDFYGKCGSMVTAEVVFEMMHSQDVVSWNALIAGYSSLGDTSKVFTLAKRMQEAGVDMNGVTLVLILTACSHAGKVEEGKKYFECMSRYGVVPTLKHYTCMVDMLGRANRVEEALSIVKGMPFEFNNVVWTTLNARGLQKIE